MRIAQIAPLYESVPPLAYGGTERVVHYLTEELVAMGHDVTLFASGDSQTAAKLVPGCARALRLDPSCQDPLAHHMVMLGQLAKLREHFDVFHFHIDYLHFTLSRALALPQLTTLHGRLDLPDLPAVYREFEDLPVVSISDAQRLPLPDAGWIGTVLHGLPRDDLGFTANPEDYFAFVGRISPEKRVDRAIAIATRLGVKLKIAAKVDRADQAYHEREIAPLLDNPLVEFIGEIGQRDKASFFGNARALLFPIDWPEPFGLVMIEAMACGTPVVAFRNGSVPEVIDDGVTGFIVSDMEQAIDAAARVDTLNRARIREVFEQRFTARRMAEDYLELYRRIAKPRVIAA
ncbi:MAG TPA: glycosyltransferase family 4 protein [Polyangiaceae bacterium]|jgi:glycosyltransferase involved in cell wall biosynthesis|nr:glycosyltransferase family 4 protein [Polyangiaceae bacterium]